MSETPVVTLMSRAGCSACAKAQAQLQVIVADFGIDLQVVDVDARAAEGDPSLRAEYGDRVPVILLNGAEHGYWEVEEDRLRADLAALR